MSGGDPAPAESQCIDAGHIAAENAGYFNRKRTLTTKTTTGDCFAARRLAVRSSAIGTVDRRPADRARLAIKSVAEAVSELVFSGAVTSRRVKVEMQRRLFGDLKDCELWTQIIGLPGPERRVGLARHMKTWMTWAAYARLQAGFSLLFAAMAGASLVVVISVRNWNGLTGVVVGVH